MTELHLKKFYFIICLALFSACSQANTLSQGDIDDYLKSFNLLKNSSNPIIQNLENSLKNNENFKFDTDENGNFAIASQVLKSLTGEQKNALSGIADNAGFSSLDEWANIADKVGAAMMAVEMSKEEMDIDMSEMTPEMLAMVPPQMREQFEGAMRMMEAVKNVPEEDIKMVKANYEKLRVLMEE